MSGRTHIVDLIDGDRHPILEPVVAAYAELLRTGSSRYRSTGICRFEGFIRPEAVIGLRHEAEQLAPLAHHVEGRESSVAYDVFPLTSALRAIYEWDGLTRLVSGITGEPQLFRSADPLAALSLSIMGDGDAAGYSAAGPTVQAVLSITDALGGGETAYVTGRRSVDPPGTLTIFDNHRVRRSIMVVRGDRLRFEARMQFGSVPGVDSTDEEKLRRFGRLPGRGRRA